MKKYLKHSLPAGLIFGLLLIANVLQATHNRAGEITVEQIDPLTIQATITTYTVTTSTQADRDSLTLCWGDGTCDVLVRINGPVVEGVPQGEELANNTKINIYRSMHVYPGLGTYKITMTDPNRNGGIVNVNPPNSDMIEFHLQTIYTLLNPQFEGTNNTPRLLQPPIDIGCVGQTFIHNPNAFDEDGDSLSYHLIVPLRGIDEETGEEIPVPNYAFPDMINPGAGNNHTLDPVTGDFIWRAPRRAGEYNIAMIIVEYRQGIPLDTMIRDMQILIQECENQPPEIEVIEEICVIAGDLLELDVIATDPDIPLQQVDLTALGGPFEVDISPASFEVAPGFQPQVLRGRFIWQTACEHISEQPYSVVFRSSDDVEIIPSGGGGATFLSTLKTVRITVVGPPPEDVLATVDQEEITVTWEKPYVCEDAAEDYFNGFSVWRRLGSNQFPPDTCAFGGLEAQGYTKLTVGNIKDMQDGRYIFLDEEVDRGRTYCYRIIANFARISAGGFPYNLVEGLPSEEICIQLDREVPLITNVDVQTTDTQNGQIEVRWTKPVVEDLDTIANPGPYRYQVLRAEGFSTDLQPIADANFISATFAGANDTVFLDSGLNTVATPYTYRIDFFVNGENEPLGMTNPASSIFLSLTPTDRAVQLSWEEQVPWDNYQYNIFRQNEQGTFDPIGTSTSPTYRDEGLENGIEYCYKIQSEGTYGLDADAAPLLNFSQEVCSIPGDNVPPCPPTLTITNICDEEDNSDTEDLFNSLSWTNPNEVCEDVMDTESYSIYYSPTEDGTFVLEETVFGANNVFFEHQPAVGIAGCYAVTAIDSLGNESEFSNTVCVDNCPFYDLPNTFTPNNDNTNDIFKPFPFRFIDRVDFKVYNRWGGLVFETNDPNLNWDGTNLEGEELEEGVYYYVCRVFESRVTGVVEQEMLLSGSIHLIRGN